MILVDSNILMYAAGAAHPNKGPATRFLHEVAAGTVPAVIDAEVLQEILHRYRALNRWTEGTGVYRLARILFSDIIPITGEIMERARLHLDENRTLSARDAIHAAVVSIHRLAGICTFDADFDRVAGCVRIVPE